MVFSSVFAQTVSPSPTVAQPTVRVHLDTYAPRAALSLLSGDFSSHMIRPPGSRRNARPTAYRFLVPVLDRPNRYLTVDIPVAALYAFAAASLNLSPELRNRVWDRWLQLISQEVLHQYSSTPAATSQQPFQPFQYSLPSTNDIIASLSRPTRDVVPSRIPVGDYLSLVRNHLANPRNFSGEAFTMPEANMISDILFRLSRYREFESFWNNGNFLFQGSSITREQVLSNLDHLFDLLSSDIERNDRNDFATIRSQFEILDSLSSILHPSSPYIRNLLSGRQASSFSETKIRTLTPFLFRYFVVSDQEFLRYVAQSSTLANVSRTDVAGQVQLLRAYFTRIADRSVEYSQDLQHVLRIFNPSAPTVIPGRVGEPNIALIALAAILAWRRAHPEANAERAWLPAAPAISPDSLVTAIAAPPRPAILTPQTPIRLNRAEQEIVNAIIQTSNPDLVLARGRGLSRASLTNVFRALFADSVFTLDQDASAPLPDDREQAPNFQAQVRIVQTNLINNNTLTRDLSDLWQRMRIRGINLPNDYAFIADGTANLATLAACAVSFWRTRFSVARIGEWDPNYRPPLSEAANRYLVFINAVAAAADRFNPLFVLVQHELSLQTFIQDAEAVLGAIYDRYTQRNPQPPLAAYESALVTRFNTFISTGGRRVASNAVERAQLVARFVMYVRNDGRSPRQFGLDLTELLTRTHENEAQRPTVLGYSSSPRDYGDALLGYATMIYHYNPTNRRDGAREANTLFPRLPTNNHPESTIGVGSPLTPEQQRLLREAERTQEGGPIGVSTPGTLRGPTEPTTITSQDGRTPQTPYMIDLTRDSVAPENVISFSRSFQREWTDLSGRSHSETLYISARFTREQLNETSIQATYNSFISQLSARIQAERASAWADNPTAQIPGWRSAVNGLSLEQFRAFTGRITRR